MRKVMTENACVSALLSIDPLEVSADWDNGDDIAEAVRLACVKAIRELAAQGRLPKPAKKGASRGKK